LSMTRGADGRGPRVGGGWRTMDDARQTADGRWRTNDAGRQMKDREPGMIDGGWASRDGGQQWERAREQVLGCVPGQSCERARERPREQVQGPAQERVRGCVLGQAQGRVRSGGPVWRPPPRVLAVALAGDPWGPSPIVWGRARGQARRGRLARWLRCTPFALCRGRQTGAGYPAGRSRGCGG
jgi:hypothetical protein